MAFTRNEVFTKGDSILDYPCDMGGSNNAIEHVVEYEGEKYFIQTNWDGEVLEPNELATTLED
jgi:hypothetical protein